MNLPRLAVARPVTAVTILVSLVVLGAVALPRLPLAFLPEVDEPQIRVEVPYPNSSPEQIEREIARPVEEILATIPGLERLYSDSSADLASFELEFSWGDDLDVVRMQVSEKMELVRSELPAGIGEVRIFTWNTTDIPVIEARISARGVDLSENWDLLEARVMNPIRRVPGVARVDLDGIEPKEIFIDLSLAAIREHGVDVGALIRNLSGAGSNLVLGQVGEGGLRYAARAVDSIGSLEALRDFPIDARGLRLSDVATVSYEEPPVLYGRHLDREDAVALSVLKESTANTVEVVHAVKRVIEQEIGADPLLRGIELYVMEEQAEPITKGIDGLYHAGAWGAALAVVCLYFFLRRLDSTAIVAISIPFSIVVSSGVMYFLGMSLNLLSMMGLMIAVGMLVDNAIVVLESIDRVHRTEPDPKRAALVGAEQVLLAVVASTATNLIVFLPLMIGEGELTTWLREVGITMSLAMLCSLLSSVMLIPLMSAHFLRAKPTHATRALSQLEERYARVLAWTFRRRGWATAILVVILALGLVPFFTGMIEADMFSGQVTQRLRMNYEFADFLYKSETEEVVNQVEEHLYARADEYGIDSVYSYYAANEAGTTLILERDDLSEQDLRDVRKRVREGLPTIPGVKLRFDEDEDQGADTMHFAVKFFGQDPETLHALAAETERMLETLPGIEDLENSFERGRKEIRVTIDRDRAAQLGLTAADIADVFSFTLGGTRLPRFDTGSREVETWIALRIEDRSNLADLKQLEFSIDDGRSVKLGDIATFDIVERAEWITRENRKVRAAVWGLYEGEAWDDTRGRIEELVSALDLPAGYSWSWNDRILEEEDQNAQMLTNVLLALALVYIVMAALFESVLQPVAILFSILFAIPGGAWMLAATDTPFNLMAQIGFLILMGVVVNNGIVMLDCENHHRRAGLGREEALLAAARARLRPILMTATTTVTGLVPLALGASTVGGLFYFPLARTVMGGLISSAVLTLLALPLIALGFHALDDAFRRIWHLSGVRSHIPTLLPGETGEESANVGM